MKAGYLILVALLLIGSGCKKVKLTDEETLLGSWSLSRYQVNSYKNGSLTNQTVHTDFKDIARFNDYGTGRISLPEAPNLHTDSALFSFSNGIVSMTLIDKRVITMYVKSLTLNDLTLETRSPITTDADLNKIQTMTDYFYSR